MRLNSVSTVLLDYLHRDTKPLCNCEDNALINSRQQKENKGTIKWGSSGHPFDFDMKLKL